MKKLFLILALARALSAGAGAAQPKIGTNSISTGLFSITNDIISTNVGTSVSMLSNYVGTTVIASNLLTPGMRIRVSLLGQYWQSAASGGPLNATNAVTLGGNLIATNHYPLLGSVAGVELRAEFMIVCRSTGTNGSVLCQGTIFQPGNTSESFAQVHRLFLRSGPVSVNTTTNLALDFTCHGTNTTAFWIRSGSAEIIP